MSCSGDCDKENVPPVKEGETNPKKRFSCDPPCPYSSDERRNLIRHKEGRQCYHKLPFSCDKCGKRFLDEKTKVGHSKKGKCNRVLQLPCPKCGMIFNDYMEYNVHFNVEHVASAGSEK